ncbi:hypothetical protein NC661_13520 [Aquibacillus koreensis]|uniref:Uncharacterized protein n=1 Tax=Aquibacillus koreensis TaxID=279446 RepID=A0A9X4AKF6_9BACI|nr:hypothetical protein [Aquibacillus koreensis]MCT2536257.1 hypothetical protein [Aquibacillus koreensis]MDC3421390.1 hypothetical protein [Aquibacillus koreensis]
MEKSTEGVVVIKNTFYYTYPILGFLKQKIKRENGLIILTVKPKIKFNPHYHFYSGSELLYKAILRKSNVLRFKFEIENSQGTHVATIEEVPIYKKSTIFKEYYIRIKNEEFSVQFKIADKSFAVKDSEHKVVIQGELISSFIGRLMNFKRYKINVFDSIFPEKLWMAIVAGVFILE